MRFYSEFLDTPCGSITDFHLPHSMGATLLHLPSQLGQMACCGVHATSMVWALGKMSKHYIFCDDLALLRIWQNLALSHKW